MPPCADCLHQAANLRDIRRNLGRNQRTPTVVPGVIEELTGEKVLVMEFCEGISLKDGAELRRAGIDCEQLVLRVCEAWALQMFRDGVFNADAHAGNILAVHDPEQGAVPILLDFGLTKRLTPAEQIAFCQMVGAFSASRPSHDCSCRGLLFP